MIIIIIHHILYLRRHLLKKQAFQNYVSSWGIFFEKIKKIVLNFITNEKKFNEILNDLLIN